MGIPCSGAWSNQLFPFGIRSKLAGSLNELKVPRKATGRDKSRHVEAGRWTLSGLYNVLRNPSYIGLREVNRKNKDEDPDSLKPWERYQLVKASWNGIVSEEVFSQVQKALEDAHLRERHRLNQSAKRVFLLSGIIRCEECSRALIGMSSHGKHQVHRYYGHKPVADDPITCKVKRFRADEVEQAVVNHLDEVMVRSGYLDQIEKTLQNITKTNSKFDASEQSRMEKQLRAIEVEIESAFKLHVEMANDPGIGGIIRERLDKLAERKKSLSRTLELVKTAHAEHLDIKEARAVIESRVKEFRSGWAKATPLTKKRLLRRVVQNLVYSTDGLKTYYVVAPEVAAQIQSEQKDGTPGSNPGVPLYALKRQNRFLLDENASSFWNGGGVLNWNLPLSYIFSF